MLQSIVPYLLTVLVTFLICVFVFAKRNKTSADYYYLAFAASIGAWQVFSTAIEGMENTATVVWLARVSLVFGIGAAVSFLLFSSFFNEKLKLGSGAVKIVWGLAAPVAVLSATPYAVFLEASSGQLVYGSAYTLNTVFVLACFVLSMIFLMHSRASAKELKKSQLNLILFGLGVAIVSNVLVNVIFVNVQLPIIDSISPLSVLFFSALVGFAMLKHKLFDISSLAVRAGSYILSVLTLAVLYVVIVYGFLGFFLGVNSISLGQRTAFALIALLIAVTFNPIVHFFNKYTSKIFYRDAYDTQEVLDQIGKIIVGSIDLHKIQKSTLTVLLDALRPTYGGFVLKDGSGEIRIQDFVGEVPKFDAMELSKIAAKIGKQGVVYDELDQTTTEYAQLLRKNDISLIVPLITKNETIGYFITGPKKSGNIFNQQDKKMLTIAANELAVALQNAQRFEEIQAFNITLQEKVTEATRELKKTNKKLVELDEAKDEFISMASHQLRTPLTSIKGYISMLMEGDLGKVSKQQEQALKEAYTSSQRMVFLIADFLNVSRIRTGKFVIEPKEVDLSEMVNEELVQLKEMAESKQIQLVYEKPANFPKVKLDENKMHQVMMNMIDNAIYYTPEEGTVTIQLFIDGKDVVFKVVDTGIGVPKAEQHKLFTKFFRAANARKARPDGTGLGLFMAQKVIVAQNGSIIFESTEGKGSTFGFRFPLSSIKP